MGWAIFIGIILFIVIGWIVDAQKKSSQRRAITETLLAELEMKCYEDTITTESGQQMNIKRIMASGTCAVPRDNYPCEVHFHAIDITDGESDEEVLPIISLFPDIADENGFLAISTELTMPYTVTTFSELQIGVIIPEGLILPKRGMRTIRLMAWITVKDTEEVLKAGSLDLNYQQKSYGYLEQDERDLNADKVIVQLAVILCQADSLVESREKEAISRFFESRMIHRDNAEEHREEISKTLEMAVNKPITHDDNIHKVIHPLAEELLKFDDARIRHDAYELCTQIVAADEEVHEKEQIALSLVAQELKIDKRVEREINDRYFRVDMFRTRSRDALLDMPVGLSEDEQISFLNQEYQKWRSRTTHKDANIRTEAEIRLKRITERRNEIDKKRKE